MNFNQEGLDLCVLVNKRIYASSSRDFDGSHAGCVGVVGWLVIGFCFFSEFVFFADSGSESGSHKGGSERGPRKSNASGGDGKPTRVRTVLNEKQLHTLRTCYAANPRPDALMKEQLVEMTSLSPRVIRVWFQNKRCKDKKKTLLIKQQMQQEKVG